MNNLIPRAVAFIPARSGSKRVPHKNILSLNGHPMLAYSIQAALQSQVFDAVICVTDSEHYADIAQHYGAEVPCLRPQAISGDTSADIEWVHWILHILLSLGRTYDAFSILRPTSPFRLPETIQRAWSLFLSDLEADSLRAIQQCKQHPGKMWTLHGQRMLPLMPFFQENVPWHSNPYAVLPEVYAQDASLEIAWSKVALERNSISGNAVIPFISEGQEGFDINNVHDLLLAEVLLAQGHAHLPTITHCPYQKKQDAVYG